MCDECEKSFRYESIKDTQNNVNNNDKECPNQNEWVFLHKVSGPCRERENCMYQHNRYNGEEKNEGKDDNNDDVNANDGAADDDGKDDEEYDQEDYEDDNEDDDEDDGKDNVTDNMFCNTSQSDESEAEKRKKRRCDICSFETEDRKRVERHRYESHSVKGK